MPESIINTLINVSFMLFGVLISSVIQFLMQHAANKQRKESEEATRLYNAEIAIKEQSLKLEDERKIAYSEILRTINALEFYLRTNPGPFKDELLIKYNDLKSQSHPMLQIIANTKINELFINMIDLMQSMPTKVFDAKTFQTFYDLRVKMIDLFRIDLGINNNFNNTVLTSGNIQSP